ncbi:hypothetical protein BpHYR1_015994 [Brachionus plicatilis]|uniref:Uncharacterized protein n=1 Tax=Brachionus plicatilis TaxID=10195 RepID=A0A3M7PBZ3_BRAPC|nr:hypothetical protein BpHYR1_015994 [Brachionus plicatilis]
MKIWPPIFSPISIIKAEQGLISLKNQNLNLKAKIKKGDKKSNARHVSNRFLKPILEIEPFQNRFKTSCTESSYHAYI